MTALTQRELHRLFQLLNEELRRTDTEGELFLVGGAVMCLAYAARSSKTRTTSGISCDTWISAAARKRSLSSRITTHLIAFHRRISTLCLSCYRRRLER